VMLAMFRKSRRTFTFALTAIMLTACDFGALPEAQNVQASSDTIVVVGKIVLTPKVDVAFEQSSRGMAYFENTVVMATGPAPALIDRRRVSVAQLNNAIKAELGTTFFLRLPRRTTFLNDAMIELGQTYGSGRMWLPGGFFLAFPRGPRLSISARCVTDATYSTKLPQWMFWMISVQPGNNFRPVSAMMPE
jgi:hypothetical protein